MRFSALATVAAIATTAVQADWLRIESKCDWLARTCYSPSSTWHTDQTSFSAGNMNGGCHKRPGDSQHLAEVCIDWDNYRGHFYFDNQPKRCLKMTWSEKMTDGACVDKCIKNSEWHEVPCTW